MSVPRDLIAANPGIGEWVVLHAYRGSIAHGMYVPQSNPDSIDDKDTMAFCVPSPGHYLGLMEFHSRGTQEIKRGEWDIVVYETRKAIRLLAQGNPNVLSMLWLPDDMMINVTAPGRHLLDHRDLFVGRHVYQAFVGYAVAQMRALEGGAHRGYMGEKRKALVERYGYDSKNAAHLIRLLRMGIEFVRDGVMNVHRHDAQELLAIKAGEWKLDRVKVEAERLFRQAEDAYERSTLPVKPDPEKVNTLCVEVVQMALDAQKRREAAAGARMGAELP